MLFDAIYMVDWSANNRPKTGADSIWIAHARWRKRQLMLVPGQNFATRNAAKDYLRDRLKQDLAAGLTVLAGFDFPNAYPKGFAQAAGFNAGKNPSDGVSLPPWRAVWQGLSQMIEDHTDNRSNRFEVAAHLNQRISGTAYPFWGRPPGREISMISAKKAKVPAGGPTLPERRITDTWVPRAQPVWKLFTTGSVGSQALLGIPVLERLRTDPDLAGDIHVWPFDTGLVAEGYSGVTLAEVYPSLFPLPKAENAIKDCLQVETVVKLLAERDRTGALAEDLCAPAALTAAERQLIVQEEGWILGVGTYQPPAKPA